MKLTNSNDDVIFKELAQIKSELGIASTKTPAESTENGKQDDSITVKEESLIRKNPVFKATGEEDNPEEGEEEREQCCFDGMEGIVSIKGDLWAPKEETALLGPYDRTRGSQEGDEKMEQEECEDEENRGKEINEENECGYPNPRESSFVLPAVVGPFDNNAHHTRGSSGSENKRSPIKKEQKEVRITMPQEDHLGDVEQTDNFHSKDLLCFAWQIAKGMVSNIIEAKRVVNYLCSCQVPFWS